MKHQKRSRREQRKKRCWTRERALAAPVVRSLREHRLEAQAQRLTARRLSKMPGRPTRDMIIAEEEAKKSTEQAKARYQEALRELHALNLKCADAIRGEVLFPFRHGDLLAWLIYELFEQEPLTTWRYRDDPDDMRRDFSEIQDEITEVSQAPRRKRH